MVSDAYESSLSRLPTDPIGGTFFIDAKGAAQNTTVLDSQTARTRNALRTAIGSYKKLKGQLPASLRDLVTAHIMDDLPPHPYANRTWQYDPTTGEIN